jgi:hypothetical protein
MPSIRIESRQELLYLLSEASELEHLLACSYLFAAYSLKTGDNEGLTPLELDAVRGWKQSIVAVAVEEMLHLCLVSNLLTAIGGAPNLHRPNLPQMSRYYPTDIQIDLSPFSEETIRHFAFLERPEDCYEDDAPRYRDATERAANIRTTALIETDDETLGVVGRPQGYQTIGELYLGIEYGFRQLTASLGEDMLFIGPRYAQITQRQVGFKGLEPVTNLETALGAIQTIVEQGEGLRAVRDGTHYWRFIEIEKEYSQLRHARRDFAPARPVLPNPFSRLPTDSPDVNLLDDPTSIAVCDLFNGIYEAMLQLLMRFLAHFSRESRRENDVLGDAAISLMAGALAPVADVLTRLPAGSLHPGMTAGPSFQFFRSTQLLPHKDAAWIVLRERLVGLSSYCERLSQQLDSEKLREVAGVLQSTAGKLVPD